MKKPNFFEKFLASFTVTVKFWAAVTFFICVILGIAIFSAVNLNRAQIFSETIFENYGISQGYVGEMMAGVERQRVYLRDAVLDRVDGAVEKAAANIVTEDAAFRENISQLGAIMTDAEGLALLKQIENDFNAFAVVRDEIVEYAQTDPAHADEVLTSQNAADIVKAIQTSIRSGMDYLRENANTSLILHKQTEKASELGLLIVGGVLTVISLFIGALFIRTIGVPIKRLSDAAGKLAQGNLDAFGGDNGLTEGKDEVVRLRKVFAQMLGVIQGLNADINLLTAAAREGRLSVRADESAHDGAFREIVAGINKTLDAVVEPVNEAAGVLGELSRGNLNARVTGEYEGDHAIIKEALNATVDALNAQIGEVSEVLEKVAEGDLTESITGEFVGDFDTLKQSVNRIVDALNTVLSDINTAAEQVAGGTKQVSDGSQATSQGATEQASSIEELTASIASIAEQTRQNALNANQSRQLASRAREGAVDGDAKMRELQQAMEEINESSSRISKVIKAIDDIAFQTNILALNAAVEAARAGVHGKGFAVVAEEVRNLAGKSANAAKETAALIEDSIRKTEVGANMAKLTAGALSSIVGGMEENASITEGIAAASSDQATAIAQVNKGIEQMSQVVQTNSATAQEAAAASEELSGQAELLKNMIGRFKLKGQIVRKPAATVAPKLQNTHEKISLDANDFGKY